VRNTEGSGHFGYKYIPVLSNDSLEQYFLEGEIFRKTAH
jgi:hypothetical protein